MVNEQDKSVDSPIQQSVEGGWPDYDIQGDVSYDADVSSDGYSSSTQSSVMIGDSESTYGTTYEGVDAVLNDLDFEISTAGVLEDGKDCLCENCLTATRSGMEGSRRQHNLLPADRHLTSGMHTSDGDSEFPLVPHSDPHRRITDAPHESEAKQEPGHDYLASSPNSPFTPNPPTPPGPSDFDEDGNIMVRIRRKRDPDEAED